MALVAGVDSSTQSCKVVVRDADTGALVRSGSAPHPDGTEVHPHHWEDAFHRAVAAAGGLDDVAAISIAGQQHGMVCLDKAGDVVRPALLWNDTRSAGAADDLVAELGAAAWVDAVGSVPVAAFTVTKLRWLAEHEPEHARRTAAVCLPHDWLTWRLLGTGRLDDLVTDRSDASGTGYFDSVASEYRAELLVRALGHDVLLPRVLAPSEFVVAGSMRVGPGAGDNAAAGLGVQAGDDVVVSLGTSGTAFTRSTTPPRDPSGAVAGFADLTGVFLPLVCTLNAARVLDAVASMLGVDHHGLSDLALSAAPGAEGLTLVPYLAGERTPNLPSSTGGVLGLTVHNATPANLARAAVEGMLCGLADAVDALRAQGKRVERVRLVGGAAASPAVQAIAPTVFGVPVVVPPAGEYVADGAARQAAWELVGGDTPPAWAPATGTRECLGELTAGRRERYPAAAAHPLDQLA
ncbi:MAG: xylulokinase [Actinobacteria bacterium]|nr:xylulokinase [Actinomycetota bacterium]